MLIVFIAAAALAVATAGSALWRLWHAVPDRHPHPVLF